MGKDVRDERTYSIIGAAMEVHSTLGHGFLEAVYQEALAIELGLRGIEYRRECPIPIRYKGSQLVAPYRADFLCFDRVIVELKAVTSLAGSDEAQVIHYLKATGFEIGLLLNFGAPRLQHQRLVFSASHFHPSAVEVI